MNWQTILTAIGGSSIITLIIQLWFKYRSDAKLKHIEAALARQQVIYAQTFPDTKQAIDSLYKHMQEVIGNLSSHLKSDHDEEKNKHFRDVEEKLFDSLAIFEADFKRNKLYLPDETAQNIQKYIKSIWELHHIDLTIDSLNKKTPKDNGLVIINISRFDFKATEIKMLQAVLEKAFRNILSGQA